MSKLLLIDGSSYLYRAFHALPPLNNAEGEPTGALFGIHNMLRSSLRERPDYAAFVCDAPGPTFRHRLYPAYKAQRPPMPEELRAQIEPMLELVEALGLPIFRISGVEADDVIGSLAVPAREQGLDVLISTGDKDLAQLVDAQTSLINTMTGVHTDIAGVIERFGVRPDQIVDFLSLTGDSVDNVPGVPKCGPKTAAKWLGEYGSLARLIEHAEAIGGKIGEQLRAALPQLPLSQQLVTIKTDVDTGCKLAALKPKEPDTGRLRAFYQRYEFKAALKELDTLERPLAAARQAAAASAAMPAAEESAAAQYQLLTDEASFASWLEQLAQAELIAFDTETTSLDATRAELVGLSFAIQPGAAVYLPVGHDYPGAPAQLDRASVLARLRPLLEDPARAKLAQHAKYDLNVLARYGIDVQGIRHDSMLESYVLNATVGRHDLDSLAKRRLDYDTIPFEAIAGKGAKQILFSQVDLNTACRYAAEDADVTLRLHRLQWPELQAQPALRSVYQQLEIPLIPVLAEMERCGVLIDAALLRRQSQELAQRMLEWQQTIWQLAGHDFNLDSPKQLQAVLFEELGLPIKHKTPKGQPSTNEQALESLADSHELPRRILAYRSLAKLRSTYTEKLPQMINPHSGRVHTSYHQAAVATGRLSSSDPNLQNIPVRTEEGRRIRQAFIAPAGWRILAADYSQIELRIMAHLSADPGLLAAFQAGGDIHRATAAEIFDIAPDAVDSPQRRAAKAINFGLMYGMSAFGLARQLGIERHQAHAYIERYFARYPQVRAFMEATREAARRDGYVETLFGRRLYLPDLDARNPTLRAGAERAAINAPMQGTAADIIKLAMIALGRWQAGREDVRMVMQVHDELVFEIRADALDSARAAITRHMEAAAELAVPLLVDIGIGANWDEAH